MLNPAPKLAFSVYAGPFELRTFRKIALLDRPPAVSDRI